MARKSFGTLKLPLNVTGVKRICPTVCPNVYDSAGPNAARSTTTCGGLTKIDRSRTTEITRSIKSFGSQNANAAG